MAKKRTMKAVKDLVAGDFVRPTKSWVGYNASVSATLSLNPRKTYEVSDPLSEQGWLGLKPGKEHWMTTVVFVGFKGRGDEFVEVCNETKNASVG